MKQAYLLLASERRVLNVVLDDDPDAIQRAIGTRLSNTAPRSKPKMNLLSAATSSVVRRAISSGSRVYRSHSAAMQSWSALI